MGKYDLRAGFSWILTGIALTVSAAGCSTKLESPGLTAGDVDPDLFCSDKLPTTPISITGDGFAPLPTHTLEGSTQLLLPRVELVAATTFDPSVATPDVVVPDDPNNPGASQVHFISDKELRIDLTKGLVAPGVYDVRVTNPDGVSTATWVTGLAIVPPPVITAFDKDVNALACLAEKDQDRTLTGKWFAKVDGQNPTVSAGGKTFTVKSMDGCTAVQANVSHKVELCTSATFTLPKDGLMPGEYDVSINNKAPIDCPSNSVKMLIVPPPTIMALNPAAMCDDGKDKTVSVEGSGFLTVKEAVPTVKIGGIAAMLVGAPADCMQLNKDFPFVQTCNRLSAIVPKALMAGYYDVTVTNPEPVACSATAPVKLTISPIPTVTKIEPTKICNGGGKITVTGTGFFVDSQMNQPAVDLVPEGGGATVPATAVQCLDCDAMSGKPGTQLSVQIGPGAKPGTVYDISVTNPGGCKVMAPFPSLTVEIGPILFMVDPFTVPNELNARVTLFATKLTQPLPNPAVWIIPAGQMMPITNLTTLPIDPAFPKRVQAIVPKGQAPGVYDVYLQDGGTCAATVLKNGLTVTNKEDLTIKSVTPPFGATAQNVPITILRDTVNSKAKFIDTPRVYLNPAKSTNPPADAKSILLTSTSFVDADTLTSVVPSGTPIGLYDVIVVNPDPTAEVGILLDGYKSVTAPPPVITAVVPPSITAQAGQVVEVDGSDFRAGAVVSASCVNGAKQPVAPPNVVNAAPMNCDMQGKGCTISATIDAGALASGFVCVIRVKNTDGTFGDFSAIGVTTPSLNLQTPVAGTDMNVARRALGSAAAKPTAAARFVYAIAGDDGTDPNTFNDVEFVSVDLFGTMGKAWLKQPYTLIQKRAFFGTAQSARYVYVVGGTDGANALATAERAQVLDPLESPIIFDLDFSYDQLGMTGLAAGEWIYRVSAEFDSDTAKELSNPGGEGLPSDEFIVKLPMGAKLGVTLFWKAPVDCAAQPLPNVKKYHIYRTPAPDAGSGKEVELDVIDASMTQYTDDGSDKNINKNKTPLLLGSTGKWTNLPLLATERSGVGAAMGVDPNAPATKRYLYALFGKNKAGTVLNSYQFLPITVDACGHEAVAAAWSNGAQTSTARLRHMTWLVDKAVRADVGANTNLVYVGGGIDTNNNQVTSVFRAKVAAGGDLGNFTNTNQNLSGGGYTGSGVLAAAQQLFLFGGAAGAPATKGVSASITDATGTLANNSWNAGLNLLTARVFMGSSVQSAFAFFVGGTTAAANASKSTELVVW